MIDQFEKSIETIRVYAAEQTILVDRGLFEQWLEQDYDHRDMTVSHYWSHTENAEICEDLTRYLIDKNGEDFFEKLLADSDSILSDYE